MGGTVTDFKASFPPHLLMDKENLEKFLGKEGRGEEYITPEYLKEKLGSRLNNKKVLRAAGVAGFFRKKETEVEDLIEKLMQLVENYRIAGYSDDEIWEVILKKIENWEKEK